MERKRSAEGNKGLYIAISCCVLIIAIIGYVSWFMGTAEKPKEKELDFPYNEALEVPNLSEVSSLPINNESIGQQNVISIEEKATPVAKSIVAEENIPKLKLPVDGKIVCEFSGENLMFNKVLSDWRTHNGMDIRAKEGTSVMVSADGVVESAYSGGLGNCVVVDHENGLKTLYANLSECDNSLVGKNVKAGDIIGTVGKSYPADFTEEEHLHFEVIMDEEKVDPREYLE